ncbi:MULTISPECIES: DUF4184 family protein [Microbacterium]|uniref:DUF4184 family protein n=1 Tax=Microbacterium TaxID=33882 RepID=UPI00146B2713|nr:MULTISPECIES: DUF4184 family protein [Microbacterium]
MPFTPSHAVVALPFVRTPLVPAAVAIGAMSPDLPLFVRGLPLHYGRTHDLVWLPATIALALVLLLVWRCLLRPAVRELSPRWLASRFPVEWDAGAVASARATLGIERETSTSADRPRRMNARTALLLVVSLAIGVLTHIVWDLFTHEGRWGVEVLPGLDEPWGPLAGYKWLQHGSSVLGLVTIGVWMLLWLASREVSAVPLRVVPDAARWCWWLSLPVILAVAWVAGLAAFGPLDDDFTVAHLAYRVLPPACALWGAATLVLCVAVQLVRRQRVGTRAEA